MTGGWADVFALIALQHVWQSAALALLAGLVLKLNRRLGADARSWVLLSAFVLAAISPLAIFLPATGIAPGWNRVASTPAFSAVRSGVVPNSTTPIAAAEAMTSAAHPVATLATIILGLWLPGFLIGIRRLAAAWVAAQRLRAKSADLPDGHRLCSAATREGVVVRVSGRTASPMVVGLLRPCILFPRSLLAELSEDTLIRILHHEVAHVRRRDLWASLLQAVCLAVYWWSPLLRLIGTRLDASREMACDERAAMRVGGAATYANALLASAAKMPSPHRSPRILAVGVLGTHSALTQRIEGLLNMDIGNRVSGIKPAVIACASVIFASMSLTLLATPRIDRAVQSESTTSDAHHDGDGALLIAAVNAQRLDTVRLLVGNGADIDARVPGDGTALIVASKRGDAAMVDELIGLGADVDQSSRGDGNPLIAAAANGHLDIVQRLLAAGADVNAIVADDETPLINAARRGHLPIVQYLVEYGADVNLGVTADFGQWRSPLNQADNAAIRRYLVDKGAVQRK